MSKEFRSAGYSYADKLPDDPAPFSYKEFVRDAFYAGYEAAMKSGLQQILDTLQSRNYALHYENDEKEEITGMLHSIYAAVTKEKKDERK
jgi:hypothetical protein